MTARAEAQVTRLSAIYSLLDTYRANGAYGAVGAVGTEHLTAALPVWSYCEQSTRFIFGDSLGDPAADELLRAIRMSPSGMTRTDIREFFQRHKSSEQIARMLRTLAEQGFIRCERTDTGGRPRETWFATAR